MTSLEYWRLHAPDYAAHLEQMKYVYTCCPCHHPKGSRPKDLETSTEGPIDSARFRETMKSESEGNMREILYSPGYGAGWTTWNSGEVAAYMLEYRPIIDYLNGGGEMNTPVGQVLIERLETECLEKFGQEYVCVLGASNLRVATIPDGKVKIDEYDGYETYLVEGDTEGWM